MKIIPCSILEAYDKTPIFIPVGIMEDVVELVSLKLPGGVGPGGVPHLRMLWL